MEPSKIGGVQYSASVLTFLQNQKRDISNGPKMLSASEISSLRQHLKESLVHLESHRKAK